MLDPQVSSLKGNKHLQPVCVAPAPSKDSGTQLWAFIKPHYPGLAKHESQQQYHDKCIRREGGDGQRGRFVLEDK